MENFFSSPALFKDLATKKIYCCGTVRPNRKGMPQDQDPKKMEVKRGDIHVGTRGHLTAILWRDKCAIYMLKNIHNAPAEGNFCDSNRKAIKPHIVADYSRHRFLVDKGDRMAHSRRTFKWTKTLFFHLFDLAILNSCILLSSCGERTFRIEIFNSPL
jgi:hypothetical protein